MVNYNNGKIYKITGGGLDPYIGSTTQPLSKRMVEHRSAKKLFEEGKRKWKISSFPLLEFEDSRITLLEEYSCKTKEQLAARERYWFDALSNINKLNPLPTNEEKRENQNKLQRKYYERDLGKSREYRKQLRLSNNNLVV
jgi:hypothetical protein